MPLVPTGPLVSAAATAGTGIGAFNVIHLETAEALVSGAEEAALPVILQISQNCIAYHGTLEPIARASMVLAQGARVPVAVHLDHAEDPQLCRQAVDMGFGSIMYDGAHLPFEDNVATTAEVARYAHVGGVYVEAELGKVGGKDGAHAPGVRTDPLEAQDFLAATGVDALAVAVGSSHAMTERSAELDVDLISALKSALDVPLVLHGSSGVSDANIVRAIQAGMTKINVSTHLNGFFTSAVRSHLNSNSTVVDSRKYIAAGRSALVPEVARLLRFFAGTGEDGTKA